MLKLATGIYLCLAYGDVALAQTHVPTHHPKTEHKAHKASKPQSTELPPDLTFDPNSATQDPSAFPGETDNQGYESGVAENPR
jgi:hypothetical protein